MDDAVKEPSNYIQHGVGETSEDVGNVGTVEDGLEGWEDDIAGRAHVGSFGCRRHGDDRSRFSGSDVERP